jgi:hypothetical protein
LCAASLLITLEIVTDIPPQEYDTPHYKLLEFFDDYRLAIKVSPSPGDGMPSRLLLLDVEGATSGAPILTWFNGPALSLRWTWVAEAGGYKPSPQDALHAPFYPDPSQRILALSLDPRKSFLVMRIETLLRLARERAGEVIQWGEWNSYLYETFLGGDFYRSRYVQCWVSGFRLFRVSILRDMSGCYLHVYDFSAHARTRFLQPRGNGRQVMHPSVTECRLPWRAIDIYDVSFGHDGVVFQVVSRFSSSWQLRVL